MSTRSMLAQRVALLCTLCACASPPAGETLVAESLKSSAKSRAEDIHDLLTQQWHPRAVESEDPAHFEVPELRPLADEMLRVLGERIRGWKTKRSEPLPLDHIPVNADLSHLRPHIGRSLLTRRPFWTSEPDVDCMERAEAALRDQVNAPNYAALLDALTLATHALSGCRVTSEDFVQEMRDLFARVAKLSPQVFLLAQMQANARSPSSTACLPHPGLNPNGGARWEVDDSIFLLGTRPQSTCHRTNFLRFVLDAAGRSSRRHRSA